MRSIHFLALLAALSSSSSGLKAPMVLNLRSSGLKPIKQNSFLLELSQKDTILDSPTTKTKDKLKKSIKNLAIFINKASIALPFIMTAEFVYSYSKNLYLFAREMYKIASIEQIILTIGSLASMFAGVLYIDKKNPFKTLGSKLLEFIATPITKELNVSKKIAIAQLAGKYLSQYIVEKLPPNKAIILFSAFALVGPAYSIVSSDKKGSSPNLIVKAVSLLSAFSSRAMLNSEVLYLFDEAKLAWLITCGYNAHTSFEILNRLPNADKKLSTNKSALAQKSEVKTQNDNALELKTKNLDDSSLDNKTQTDRLSDEIKLKSDLLSSKERELNVLKLENSSKDSKLLKTQNDLAKSIEELARLQKTNEEQEKELKSIEQKNLRLEQAINDLKTLEQKTEDQERINTLTQEKQETIFKVLLLNALSIYITKSIYSPTPELIEIAKVAEHFLGNLQHLLAEKLSESQNSKDLILDSISSFTAKYWKIFESGFSGETYEQDAS
jgi:hypothetical protein